ncbi:MAG TPA: hypothetical protein VE959_27345 [Bryobacteraceae bacterium]|nr:hypothetical protein [Bryobacteraceae bacterium]
MLRLIRIFCLVLTANAQQFTQQGNKLAGTGISGALDIYHGNSVAISADGNTAIIGGGGDNSGVGAAWIFTRTDGVWSQQGGKLVGSGAAGLARQGSSVEISADGNTVIEWGPGDSNNLGAAWIFRRTGNTWSQQGSKLVGPGAAGLALQAPPPPVTTPSPTSANPAAGSATTGAFTFAFSDTGGFASLTVLDVLINNALDGRQACYVAFVPSGANTGALYLVDDAGDAGGPYSGMTLPGNQTVSNGQCTITGAGSFVSSTGNTLMLTLAITFTPGFAGNKVFYMSAQDIAANSGWQALGTWGVPGSQTPGPAVSGMNPARGTSAAQTYTFTFTDTNGWQDITVANILINTAIDGRHGCYLAYLPGSSSVFLVDDAGDAGGPYSGMVLPGTGTVSNSQCSISGVGSSVAGIENTLILTLAMTFNPSFAGNHVFFLAARSNTLSSNWQALGSVSVP